MRNKPHINGDETMKNWVLWLDDERNPTEFTHREIWEEGFKTEPPIWCSSLDQVIAMVKLHGLPSFMFLDHDLGYRTYDPVNQDYISATGMVFLRKLEALGFVENVDPPEYSIISANTVGAVNMQAFMESWKKSRKL